MNATWDQDTDAYYFGDTPRCVANVTDLGDRHVTVLLDHYGAIIGVDVS